MFVYLEDALVEVAGGDLEGVVGAVVERPGAADGEAHLGAGAEHAGDAVPGPRLHGLVHEPVGVPPVGVERPPVQEQLRAAPLHEGRRHGGRRAGGGGPRAGDGGGGGHGREGNVAEVHLAEGEVEQRHAGGHAEDVVQGQAAAHRHCCRRVGGVVSWGEL